MRGEANARVLFGEQLGGLAERSRLEAGHDFGIGDAIRSRLLNLDVRPPSHRQWSELRHIP